MCLCMQSLCFPNVAQMAHYARRSMHVSNHTVKRYISEAIGKTCAQDRGELAKFIAMNVPQN